MKTLLKRALILVVAVSTSLTLLSGVASLADHDREALAHTLLARAVVTAALRSDVVR